MAARERREHRRVFVPFPVKYRSKGRLIEMWHDGKMTDISAGGLRFVADEQLEQDCDLEFQLVLPIRREPYNLVGNVVWIKDLPHREWEYGVSFIGPGLEKQLGIDELVRFLSQDRTITPKPKEGS